VRKDDAALAEYVPRDKVVDVIPLEDAVTNSDEGGKVDQTGKYASHPQVARTIGDRQARNFMVSEPQPEDETRDRAILTEDAELKRQIEESRHLQT
jgi:hypothetical protein